MLPYVVAARFGGSSRAARVWLRTNNDAGAVDHAPPALVTPPAIARAAAVFLPVEGELAPSALSALVSAPLERRTAPLPTHMGDNDDDTAAAPPRVARRPRVHARWSAEPYTPRFRGPLRVSLM